MESTALRIYGKKDLRIDTFDLPEMKDDEILATVVSDTMCMSSWKLAMEGEDHKKTPDDLAQSSSSRPRVFWKNLKSGQKVAVKVPRWPKLRNPAKFGSSKHAFCTRLFISIYRR